jgi:hypothetical protein
VFGFGGIGFAFDLKVGIKKLAYKFGVVSTVADDTCKAIKVNHGVEGLEVASKESFGFSNDVAFAVGKRIVGSEVGIWITVSRFRVQSKVKLVGLLRRKFQVQKDNEILFGGGGRRKLESSRVINVLKNGYDIKARRGKNTKIIQKSWQMLRSKGVQEVCYVLRSRRWWRRRRVWGRRGRRVGKVGGGGKILEEPFPFSCEQGDICEGGRTVGSHCNATDLAPYGSRDPVTFQIWEVFNTYID